MFIQRCITPDCRADYKIDDRLYVCPRCGGLLDIERTDASAIDPAALRELWRARLTSRDARDRSGVWRFREFLPFNDEDPIVTLAEGNTPLYDAPRSADYCGLRQLQLKHQGNNPTGSFKDTGMTVAVTQARKLGARLVACASTGNTAASLAAYAARANLVCAIIVPSGQVSHAKLAQALDYGAKVLEIDGNFDTCMSFIRELSEDSAVYLVNSINPFRIEGQKTVAFELAEQLEWRVPDHLVVPGGNLGNSSAFGKGFRELLQSGLIDRQPKITVVQAAGAAPFARLYSEHDDSNLINELDPKTLASAIKIGAPVSWRKALRAVHETGGSVITVTEQEIADAKAMIGRDGIGCEPASATTVAGMRKLVAEGVIKADETVVGVLTGHLLKDTDYVMGYHGNTLVGPDGEQMRGRFTNAPIQGQDLQDLQNES
ncbi:MAG TPA: threonine synthase [Pyrinomonadaceae bacterium]|nr:threonine synthase [Pyrinomonadaceae bacterium]